MGDPNTLHCKVFMKDGHWLVPPEERPPGWERFGLLEECIAEPISVPSLEPTQEQVAEAVASVHEASELPKLSESCEVRPKQSHHSPTEKQRWDKLRADFDELAAAIDKDAENLFGDDSQLPVVAKVLVAGMFTRGFWRIKSWVGTEHRILIAQAMKRFEQFGIWDKDGGVFLREAEGIDIVLLSLVGAGELRVSGIDGDDPTYSAI
jgi:hypothetical protein